MTLCRTASAPLVHLGNTVWDDVFTHLENAVLDGVLEMRRFCSSFRLIHGISGVRHLEWLEMARVEVLYS